MKSRVFISILSVFLALGLLFSMVTPIAAGEHDPGSQHWNLDILDNFTYSPGIVFPTDDNDLPGNCLQMEKTGSKADNEQGIFTYNNDNNTWYRSGPGEVKIAQGASQIWIADQAAQADVEFYGDSQWELELVIDKDWNPADCVVDIGEWDGSFNSFGTELLNRVIDDNNSARIVLHYQFQLDDHTVYKGNYLAVQVTNIASDSDYHTVYCGEGEYSSCLSSPGVDSGYPLPELSSSLLLGAGTLGLGGFILLRRRRCVS
jgi:hypothetical protein